MNKIAIITLLLIGLTVNIYSQSDNEQKNTIGVHIAPGTWGWAYMMGLEPTVNVGIDFSRRLSTHWSVMSGIEQISVYNKNRSKTTIWENEDGLHYDSASKGAGFDRTLTAIPVQLKYHFKNHGFVNFGPSLDFYHSVYNAKGRIGPGLGWRIGGGYEHAFQNNIVISLNPYIKWGGLFTYPNFVFGVSLGAGYKF